MRRGGCAHPIDERPDRNPAYDAQRSAANTNDLRGKLLRIHVEPDGSYTIPKGNLFRPGTPRTRPEIYAMGLRNPFRFAVDRRSGVVYLADYSPDAIAPDPNRGPAGQGKWMIVRKAGNYGWPYCATPQFPYRDYDFATGVSGPAFDCSAPVNDSPHNTNDPRNRSTNKWPRYFDGVPIFYEWTRDALFEFRLDRRGRFDQIRPLLPSTVFQNPIDMQFGPDGALYTLEYGDGYFSENPAAQLARVDFVQPGNFTPVPVVTASANFGLAPLTVQLSSAGTADPDGDELTLAWDFNADGVVDSTEPNPSVTYDQNGNYAPTLRATDSTGRSATAAAHVVVGNTPPVLTFVTPQVGDAFEFGQTLSYQVSVSDNEPVDCSRVQVQYILGHETHGHPLSTAQGCTGSFTTALDAGHQGADNLAAVLVAQYTDAPSRAGIPALTGQAVVVLPPTPPPGAAPPPAPAAPAP